MRGNKKIYLAIVILAAGMMFLNLNSVLAETLGGLDDTAGNVGYNTGTETSEINNKIGVIINVVLSLIGLIFMILIWLGALDIVGANGNEELVKKGKDRIKNGAIGILIIFIAYLFTKVVLSIAAGGVGGIFNI